MRTYFSSSLSDTTCIDKTMANTRADANKLSPPSLPRVPYRFIMPQGLEIDLRLCSQDTMSSAKPYLLQILNAAMQV